MPPTRKSNRRAGADLVRAASEAQRLLRDLGLESPSEVPIRQIAAMMGVTIDEVPLVGAVARLQTWPDRYAAIEIASCGEVIRAMERFSIAHELGHLVLHADRTKRQSFHDEPFGKADKNCPREREAELFAACFLMPESHWRPRLSRWPISRSVISELADEYEVSLQAAVRRVVELCGRRSCAVISSGGKVTWTHPSAGFGHRLWNFKVREPSLAWNYFAGRSCRGEQDVAPTAWLREPEPTMPAIREICWPMPRNDSALSLLMIP